MTYIEAEVNMCINERRVYQRSNFNSIAKVSLNGYNWVDFDILDLSSSGLRMELDNNYEIGEKLFFDISLFILSMEHKIIIRGAVKRKQQTKYSNIYGVSFESMPADEKIRIDEMISHMRPKNITN